MFFESNDYNNNQNANYILEKLKYVNKSNNK